MKDPTLETRPGSGFSRREFFKGSAAAAAATAVGNGIAEAQEAAAPAVVLPGMSKIKLDVNGESREVAVEPRITLLEALRYGCGLTGAKPVSIDASSGASTVWSTAKSPRPTRCSRSIASARRFTPSKASAARSPTRSCKAFVHNDAMQCGFCTPGFVVAVRTFLDKNPNATEAEIRAGLNGNLCRCGTYANVIMAAVEVVKGGK